MPSLPTPEFETASAWTAQHLGHLVCDAGQEFRPARRGGQRAADAALAGLDVTGYAKRRSQVEPRGVRGATVLSPYLRHGLLTLAEAVDASAGAPVDDRMVCLRAVRDELEQTGWLVNQTRMWLASHLSVRAGHDWRDGEDWMFRHLLDGSRAANRYGWQWSVGSMTSDAYGFSRWQVERRARAWCTSCPLANACPIEDWPTAAAGEALDDSLLRAGVDLAGPVEPVQTGVPDQVWLTAESLGVRDPALLAWPEVPAVFVFDEPLLAGLRLSGKRLVFLAETLADLAEHRSVRVLLGNPVDELADVAVASTFAPVPGYGRLAERVNIVATHPYPWLRRPDGGDVRSHSTWIRRLSRGS